MTLPRRSFTLYLVLVHLLLVVVLLRSDFSDRVRRHLGALPPEITRQYRSAVLGHQRRDPNVPAGAVLFIGDSLTEGLCVSAVTSPAVNFGIGNDTTLGVLQRLPRYRSVERARAVVLAVGVNDLRRRSNQDILENYRAILDIIPPRLPVVLCAILPLGENLSKERSDHDPGRLRSLNSELRALAEARPELVFCDAGPALADQAGHLIPRYHTGDGIHLNGDGYGVWIDALRAALRRATEASESPSPDSKERS